MLKKAIFIRLFQSLLGQKLQHVSHNLSTIVLHRYCDVNLQNNILVKSKLCYYPYIHGGLKWIVNSKHSAKIQTKTKHSSL